MFINAQGDRGNPISQMYARAVPEFLDYFALEANPNSTQHIDPGAALA